MSAPDMRMLAGLTTWDDANDAFHFFLEPDFQYPVRFVDDERLEVLEHESFGVLCTVAVPYSQSPSLVCRG